MNAYVDIEIEIEISRTRFIQNKIFRNLTNGFLASCQYVQFFELKPFLKISLLVPL